MVDWLCRLTSIAARIRFSCQTCAKNHAAGMGEATGSKSSLNVLMFTVRQAAGWLAIGQRKKVFQSAGTHNLRHHHHRRARFPISWSYIMSSSINLKSAAATAMPVSSPSTRPSFVERGDDGQKENRSDSFFESPVLQL